MMCSRDVIVHILRMIDNRVVKHSVKRQFDMGLIGNIFMDIPVGMSFSELEKLISDRKKRNRIASPAPGINIRWI